MFFFFFWYPFRVKGYKVLDLSTHNIFISRDVIFHKDSFPFATVSTNVVDHFASSSEVDVASSSSVMVLLSLLLVYLRLLI